MNEPGNVLKELLAKPMPRQPIVVDADGITVTVELAAGTVEGSDPGYANFAARKLVREFHADLRHLDAATRRLAVAEARTFVSSHALDQVQNWASSTPTGDAQPAVEQWNHRYTIELAKIVASAERDVLELGFGMGVSATEIQRIGVRSHTVIECHPDVIWHFADWRAGYPGRDIRLLEGGWQQRLPECGKFHGILFDAYPLDEREWDSNYVSNSHFAEQFFATAANHLYADGVFTYYSNETDSLSRAHQRALFEHFAAIETSVITGLRAPVGGNAWQADSFLLVTVRQPRRRT